MVSWRDGKEKIEVERKEKSTDEITLWPNRTAAHNNTSLIFLIYFEGNSASTVPDK